jgi:ParB family chromosome partitioning protein
MVKETKKNLGKGLSALLGGDKDPINTVVAQNMVSSSTRVPADDVLPIHQIYPGRFQPRQKFSSSETQELADSIKAHGILQPILVRKHRTKSNSYEIIAGERRWRAAQLAQLHEVPVILKEFSDLEALEIGLVENLQRENLSTMEEAESYRRLVDEFNHTQEDVAKRLGKSRPYVSNTIRLLNLPNSIKDMLRDGLLTAGHARALLNTDDPVGLAKKVLSGDLSVRQTEKLCKGSGSESVKPRINKAPSIKDPNIISLETDLTNVLGLDVEIDFQMDGGSIKINYGNLEQLDDVIYRLSDGKHGKR